jgi:hypothetical protein
MSINNLTPAQLRNAADLQEKIAKLQSQLADILVVNPKPPLLPLSLPRKKAG